MDIPRIDYLQEEAKTILAESDYEILCKKWRDFLRYYEALNYDFLYDFPLWRARKCVDYSGFTNIAELKYPPPVNYHCKLVRYFHEN